jgi:hypothetical protein
MMTHGSITSKMVSTLCGFKTIIKDQELSTIAERLQSQNSVSAEVSRSEILQAIERLYTAPATKPA